MAKRKKTSKQSTKDQAKKGQSAEGAKTGWLKAYWLSIGVPVIIALLAAWLSPLPGYIVHMFKGHGSSPLKFAPVTASVQDPGPCAHEWVARSAVPKPPRYSEDVNVWDSWVKAAQAVEANSTLEYVTIQAKRGYAVFITNIRFDVVKRRPPIHGILVFPGCGGPLVGRFIAVLLDHRPPRILGTSSDPTASVGGAVQLNTAPLRLPYEVTNTDGLVLILEGVAEKFDCVWSAEITWSSDGHNGQIEINNKGKPFETTPQKF